MAELANLDEIQFHSLWIEPPLAFARIGNSDTPLQAFNWQEPDMHPSGTGMGTIQAAPSLEFLTDGSLEIVDPQAMVFQDEQGIRPVCPFFELHGQWETPAGPGSGPVTHELVPAEALVWTVKVANLKAFNLTLDMANQISAEHSVRGDATDAVILEGGSPTDCPHPLVPADRHIELGRIRPSRSSDDVSGYRLRFYPPRGRFYSSRDVIDSWDVEIPEDCRFLEPRSSWMRWKYDEANPRATPQGQYAADEKGFSYGIVDDMSDGIISCTISNQDCSPALARIVVGPPDYAPDRRPLVSLADGLKDRVDREEVAQESYFLNMDGVDEEVADLFQRIFETASLINLDVLADFHGIINPRIAAMHEIEFEPDQYFTDPKWLTAKGLPLTEGARRAHRRLMVLRFAKDVFRRKPELLDQMIRSPTDRSRLHDHRMPAFMHGSDSRPLTLTPRQHTLLKNWVARLKGKS